jgi:AraC-like DNA-binding protein
MANNIVQRSHDWLQSPHTNLLAWWIPWIAIIAGLSCPSLFEWSSLRRGTLPAVNSSIRFVWITPRAFCIAGQLLNASQPLSEIGYTCGSRDYTHFARQFRRRFGHPPGAAAGHSQSVGNGTERARTADSAR